jgi:hypothetical protein
MKTKILYTLIGIIATSFLLSFAKQEATCTLLLTNTKTNKSIKVCDPQSVQHIEKMLGGAISLDKEIPYGETEPFFIFTYDGLVIEMKDGKIISVAITNKKWKLNTLLVGASIAKPPVGFERSEFNYIGNPRFKWKTCKAIVFTEIDKAQIVKKIGVAF